MRIIYGSLIAAFVAMAAPAAAQAETAEKSIALSDANVAKYVARLRVTKGSWDYLKITLRDTFKQWSRKGGSGANLLLDPGYTEGSIPDAGLARTTPLVFYFGSSETPSRSSRSGNCGACDGVNTNYNCGSTCDYGSTSSPPWCQVRRPGFNGGDYPGISGYMRGNGMGGPGYFHEFGFYIAPAASSGGGLCPTATVFNDFTQQQVCTTGYSYDTGSGKTGGCTGSPASVLGIATVAYNARIFIYPNMQQEYATDPLGWVPPVRRGPYSGTAGRTGYAHTTYTNCAGNPQCVDCGNCNSCAVWICIKTGDKWRLGDCNNAGPACTGQWTRSYYNYFKALPTSTGAHDPSWGYDAINGSYFRQGDDTAFYMNVYQMQIHSVDRASAFPNDCELERIYTGTMSGGQPYYITDNQKVANCMRPKMYYSLAESKWKQCDAFDTWNTDGTLNPANDDAKWLYPGHPDTGGYSSPGRCGRQPCTSGSCTVGGNGAYVAGSWTANLNDIFSPGGGWYMMRLNNYTLTPGSNRIDVSFTSPDIRIEVGAVVDADACAIWICYNAREKRFLGRLRSDALNLSASIYLYSIDDTSCNPTYPNSCSGNFQRKNNNKVDPDKFVADIQVNTLDIVPPGGDWLDVYTCDDLFLGITLCDILNLGFVRDMLITELENAVKDMIAPALGDIVSSIPQLNDAFGDPLDMGTVLFDGGFYLVGDPSQAEFIPPSDGYTKRYPLFIKGGPTAAQNLVDIRAGVGFKPIAFRPMSNANWNKKLMEIDTNDPPLADSVFGIPTLYNADTSMCASNNYCNTAPNPDVEVHTGCSSTHAKTLDSDQKYDTDDYCQGTQGYATSGTYRNQKTGGTIAVTDGQLIPEHWEGPIALDKQPPAWCMAIGSTGGPRTLRTGATAANFASLYPQTTWLSFHSTLDTNPAGAAVAKNTIGNWDQMPGNTVLRQNFNNGSKDPNPITYDMSAHIHQRFFAQFFQALIATGVTCLEFAAQDTMGEDTMFKDFLRADRFATFMPEVSSLFPGWYAKIRFSPVKTPHVRTGIGSLTFTPAERIADPVGGPLPIVAQPYTLGAAFPDIRIEFLVEDPNTPGSEVSLMTTYWSPVVGVYAKAVRQCYKLDPLKNDPQCTSTFTNVRTVSGYYEIFADLNSASLKTAFENVKDGFAAGTFSNPGIGNTRGSAAFVIEKSYCNFYPGKCNEIGLLASMPTLLNSLIQVFLVSRISFYNLTVDFLYVGPDGPNDDGVGAGDYLGVYARLLGNLNVFGLLDTIALLAPNDLKPQAIIKDAKPEAWYTVNQPEVEVGLRSAGLTVDSELSYTYRVDSGFWHTPVNDPKLKLDPLLEGGHTLEIRPFEDTPYGARTNMVPTVLKVYVDTVPPDATILPSPTGYYKAGVDLKISDLQTPADQIKREFSWDGGNDDFVEFSGDSVPVRGLSDGRHTLRVRVTDLAGNRATFAKEVVVRDAGWSCGGLSCAVDHTGRRDVSVLLVVFALLAMRLRRRRAQA